MPRLLTIWLDFGATVSDQGFLKTFANTDKSTYLMNETMFSARPARTSSLHALHGPLLYTPRTCLFILLPLFDQICFVKDVTLRLLSFTFVSKIISNVFMLVEFLDKNC